MRRLFWHTLAVATLWAGAQSSSAQFPEDGPSPFAPPRVDSSQASDGDLVMYAGGAVQLEAPRGWWISEVPLGREVRLVLSPERLVSTRAMPQDGLWFSYHALPRSALAVETELMGWIARRAQSAVGDEAELEPPNQYEFRQWRAVEQRYLVPGTREHPEVQGSHLLIRTDWGFLEIHTSAPGAVRAEREDQFASILGDLVLKAPQHVDPSVEPHLVDAVPVLGTWKAFRSRLRLFPDGAIQIELDRPRLIPPASSDPSNWRFAPQRLEGTFRAAEDLLFVQWSDGSRMNLRWRVEGTDLLLTDHEGQISQLRRLYE